MNAICGILGRHDDPSVKAMARALRHRGGASHVLQGRNFVVASSHPLTQEACLLDGAPRDASGSILHPHEVHAHVNQARRPEDVALRGSFSAAVYRTGDNSWWLLRDRLGRKPLYYFKGHDYLLFASELKALVASGLVKKSLDFSSVDRMLTLGCVPGDTTIVEGVHRVPPGKAVMFTDGKVQTQAFSGFDLREVVLPRDQAAERLRGLLRQAVNRHDAEELLWASGIDCAAVAALRQRVAPLFVNLEHPWQDEAKLAKESARLLKLKLRIVSAHRLTVDTFRKAVYHLDEPAADASAFPLWLIFEQASEHADTFISGFGADELLGGYPRYRFLQMSRGARAMVPVTHLSALLPALPPNAFVRRGSKYLASIRDSLEAYLSLLSVFDREERGLLYTDRLVSAVGDRNAPFSVIEEHFVSDDLMRSLMSLDLGVMLPDHLMTKCDRMAAAHGIEVLFPYLDDDLVDFLVKLSPTVKYGVRSKPLLRHALKGYLPARVRLRAQRDFHVPQGGPVFRVIEEVAKSTLTRERVQDTGLFHWRYVEEVMRSANHNVYRRRQFWALLMFFAWHREIFES